MSHCWHLIWQYNVCTGMSVQILRVLMVYDMGCATRKYVLRHKPTSAQSDQGFHCPQTESFNTIECSNEEQMPQWDFAHVQDYENPHILHVWRHFFAWHSPCNQTFRTLESMSSGLSPGSPAPREAISCGLRFRCFLVTCQGSVGSRDWAPLCCISDTLSSLRSVEHMLGLLGIFLVFSNRAFWKWQKHHLSTVYKETSTYGYLPATANSLS